MTTTKVIFRKYRNGEVIALFPEITENDYSVLSYERNGQHAPADYSGVIKQTRPATTGEAAGIKSELEAAGYHLQVLQRAKVRF